MYYSAVKLGMSLLINVPVDVLKDEDMWPAQFVEMT